MQNSRDAATLDAELLRNIDAYWRAANYLSVGQIFLCANPLLREPLEISHVKRMLLGHWGTTPGQNFIYTHLNRVIKKFDLDMIYLSGPGHGGPAVVSGTYLEGTYSEIYADISEATGGLQRLFKQFSFPGGIPSHASAECPGSIHEGGELGYSLSHAFGAVFDNPALLAACVIGDGEAETGPLATAWHSNKFLNPKEDGARCGRRGDTRDPGRRTLARRRRTPDLADDRAEVAERLDGPEIRRRRAERRASR
jgi:xylulose-5-phosphate/fructose-6-phosphate phosphoketolase